MKRRNSRATPARRSLRQQVGQGLRGLACVVRDDRLVQGRDCSSGFPMPRMPAAVWTIIAANPVIAWASDRFRLHYAGAERAAQTDQQQNCYQPSKHASLSPFSFDPTCMVQTSRANVLYMSNSTVGRTQRRGTVMLTPANCASSHRRACLPPLLSCRDVQRAAHERSFIRDASVSDGR